MCSEEADLRGKYKVDIRIKYPFMMYVGIRKTNVAGLGILSFSFSGQDWRNSAHI